MLTLLLGIVMGLLASSTDARGISLGEIGRKKLRSLASALDLGAALVSRGLDVFSMMSEPWGHWAVGDSPAWSNDISDDGTPFEFSASFDGATPKLRMLVESQRAPISSTSSWAAGLSLGQRLKARGLADLSSFEEIQDLFAPAPGARARFSLWHAAVLDEAHPPLFKAYVNPCIAGLAGAPHVVEQALRRLGFEDAWRFLKERLAPEFAAHIVYFSVDLESTRTARVKVYLACSESAEAVQRLITGASNVQPDDAARWLGALAGGQGPFQARPILSCFSFCRNAAKPDVTVHVPIRCYVKHDAEAASRVSTLLTSLDGRRLTRALEAVSDRALDVGRGLLTYASLRREASAVRVTVYVAPEAYSITSRRQSEPPPDDAISGVHKSSPRSALPIQDLGKAQELVALQAKLLGAQPLIVRLNQPGTPEQAQRVASYLCLFALWVGDLIHFAQERTSQPALASQLAERERLEQASRTHFFSALAALGVSGAAPPPFSEEHQLVREMAFEWVADVIAAEDDCVRLGMVLLATGISKDLLDRALGFVTCSIGAGGHSSNVDSLAVDRWPDLAQVTLPDDIVGKVYAGLDRSFQSMLRMFSAVDRAIFN